MKKFFLILFGALLVSSIWAPPADASHDDRPPRHGDEEEFMDVGPGHRGHFHGKMCFGDPEFMKKKVGLSDDQIKKIEEINLKFHKQLLERKEQLGPKNLKLKRLLLEEKVELAGVEALLKEISLIEADIRLDRIKHRIEIENLLTDEQKKKMRLEMRRSRRDHD